MKLKRATAAALTTTLCLGILSLGAHADSQDNARALREAGDILPLATLISDSPELRDARILEAEFEREDGRYVYEIEYLMPSGEHRKGYFDAATGELVKAKRKD